MHRPNRNRSKRKAEERKVNPNVNFKSFVDEYLTQTLAVIGGLNGNKECAIRALNLLLTEYRGNIQGCYIGLWDAAQNLEYPEFEAKVENDIRRNVGYIKNNAPPGCVGDFTKQFGKSVFEEIEKEVRHYASR